MADATIRAATAADSRACFDVFRRSLWDLMRRTGYLPLDAPDPDPDEQWAAYRSLFDHLADSCAEWWIAERTDGQTLGYARSIERASTVELTEFFVTPGARVGGLGRRLLEHAFAVGLGTHRSIIATVDAPAVGLYLRFGVSHQTTGVDMTCSPHAAAAPEGYEVAPATLDAVVEIDAEVLGHARPQDVAFMLGDRPAVVLRRGGRPVAYAFMAYADGYAGPVAARDPLDLPAALAELEGAAHATGMERLDLTVRSAREPPSTGSSASGDGASIHFIVCS